MKNTEAKSQALAIAAVALGYFVDLYDLLLFSSVRAVSLKELGIIGAENTRYGTLLLNLTVLGMVIGGVFWGMIADKKGRLTILFSSIIMYSTANIVNAFVYDINLYIACRIVAGFGLAGELGVGITLVSEKLPKHKRTFATAVITACGMLGAAFSGISAMLFKDEVIMGLSGWRFLFLVGGCLGILLLLFRVRVSESSLFLKTENTESNGNFIFLISDRKRLYKYLLCIGCGLPVFFIVGNFIALAPEYGKSIGIEGVEASVAICCCYISIAVFDLIGTMASKKLQSRKKVLYLFLAIQAVSILAYLYIPVYNLKDFYFRCILLGAGIGYWGVMVINSVEQFGTNLRATVATSVPNWVRFALLPLSYLLFLPLQAHLGTKTGGAITAFITVGLALASVSLMDDKFEHDINFKEI